MSRFVPCRARCRRSARLWGTSAPRDCAVVRPAAATPYPAQYHTSRSIIPPLRTTLRVASYPRP
eukprot:3915926-Rhodomonas_salina.1